MLRVPATEDELLPFIEGRFKESFQFMEPMRSEWRQGEALYNGSHLGFILNNNKFGTQLQLNVVLGIISRELPIVMNNIPTISALPRDIDDVLAVSLVDKTMKSMQVSGELRSTLEQVALDYKMYGNGIWSHMPLIQDNKLKGRRYKAVNPFGWFPSPDALDLDTREDSTYQIFGRVMSISDIRANKKWKNRSKVQAESSLERFLSFQSRHGGHTGSGSHGANSSGKGKSKLSGTHALVKQILFEDKDKSTYPTDRIITFTATAILEDRAILGDFKPKADDDFNNFMPFKMIKNHGSQHGLFGRGEPEILKTVSVTLNESLSATADNIRTMGNPSRLIDPAAWNEMETEPLGIPNENHKIAPGLMKIMEGAGIPSSTFAFIELLFFVAEEMTGAKRVVGGDKPPGVESGRAIIALQQSATSLIESQTRREFRRPMRDFTEFELWTIKNFVKETTIRDEGINQILEELDEVPDGVQVSQAGGFVFTKINFEDMLKNTQFDIEINEGVSIPKGSVEWENMLSNFVADGTIDQAERIRQTGVLTDKSRLIAAWKSRQAGQAAIEREEEARKQMPQFRKLISEANKLFEDGTQPMEFANTATAMNLSVMIETFRQYLDSPEWLTLNTGYQRVLLEVFLESPQEDAEIQQQGQTQPPAPANGNGTTETGQVTDFLTQFNTNQ